ncbi:MAG: CBS domain-containing protein [Gemmatimonadales bacterium]|nr:CBS domain-containing protein [Gemmatimonadales bacterium]NIN12234.1 CBS domain-containing protein [Gemmatimonadales bacterium]NIN50649.1 CBS domain-containing protein [Gemmatimonadales bacterium]NIP08113.1 CBS domain-containing protein [Gemmatimonadales bacterium]NIR03403.1 CBS domain-containing protein [Gemmatimonadales bacterium]
MPNVARLRAWHRAASARVSDWAHAFIGQLPRLGVDENTLLLGFAVAIGTAVGLTVIVFYKLIDLSQTVALTAVGRLTGFGSLAIVLVVVAGLALTRLLVRYGTKDSDGENIPDVMLAVAKRGGTVHAGPVAVKTASAALAIGTGGSVGAEGPVAVAGSALGSKIGRFFRSGPERLRLLVACGAAAGISAAFNAPIAGVFFSLEKVIGSFGVRAFPPVLVASVIAAVISRAAFGDSPVIEIPTEYGVGSASELLLYALLGVVTGVVAVLYTRGVYRMQDLLGRLKLGWHRILVGALLVAALDVLFKADLWGQGHETLSIEIIGARSGHFLVGLALAKILVTAATLAVVRTGGVFTPALFIGATLAGGLGASVAELVPGFTIEAEAFALVGMAGLVAGSTHAPLTAIMIVFEMTYDYALILPLMLCGAIAYITARRVHPESIYSEWLVRRGENIRRGRDTAVMERLQVGDSYNRDPHIIGENASVAQIMKAIGSSPQIEFPVMDADLKLVGMITYDDLRTVLTDADRFASVVLAGDLASPHFERVTRDDSLKTALQKLAVRGSHYIPVVDSEDPDRLLGVIGRQEILAAYDREVLTEQ